MEDPLAETAAGTREEAAHRGHSWVEVGLSLATRPNFPAASLPMSRGVGNELLFDPRSLYHLRDADPRWMPMIPFDVQPRA
jgi:hypothetical protein